MESALKPVVRFKSASISFGVKMVLRPFDLEAFALDVAVISGPSGSGKTSLLRLAAGLIPPSRGSVERAPGLRVGFAFQSPRLLPWRRAWENVAIPLMNEGRPPREAEKIARALLAEFDLANAADFWPASLSGGMAQRVSLARALAIEPDLLLLDEPTAGLDAAARDNAIQVIQRSIARRKPAVLIATHHVDESRVLANRFWRCEDGAIEELEKLRAVPAMHSIKS